ncbi:amino acid ABC transporter substrate-binding protein [Roseibium limicola]|uniref:Amino acid ABC transporter substrate-binding protein n=1 Tax=Roseibium limicola TaxID=2816037 RepID=A0A939EMM3_9HYPH|nr:amino acid ABC transporter substrate-binding protein [Roseibium limicola]MBO0345371.1 amino acid ABC transporter substrate-binding protein [Roseibium limicola]
MNKRKFLARATAGLTTLAAASLLSFTALAADTIKIGTVAPKTGPLAGGSLVSQWPNVDLWVHEVNERGGLKMKEGQKKIELIAYDDKTNPTEHIKAVQRLATQDKVDFIIAPYGTGFNIAAAPIYSKYGYPQIAVTSVTDQIGELTERFPSLFFTLGDTTSFVAGLKDVLVKLKDSGEINNKIAMVNVADAFGIELADVARPLLQEAGFELVYDKSYPLGTPDLSPIIKGAKATEADSFIAWSYPPDTFGLTEQAVIENYDVKVFYTAVATAFPAYAGKFGSKIENVLGAGGVNPDTDEMKAYRARHEEVTGKAPDYWASANTYASLQILEAAIEGVGEVDREAVTNYIKSNTFDTIMGPINFDDQNSNRFWTVGQWQEGVFRGVVSSNIEGAVDVKLKDGWN